MTVTRRAFIASAAASAVGAALFTSLPADLLVSEARAQGPRRDAVRAPTPQELMEPGPLPDQVLGSADAPVTIIEYASLTCSHCADFENTTYPQLKQRYIETGKVRYILREFPLDPLAEGASMLSRCAGEGKYYPMVEALFAKQKEWAFAKDPIPPLLAIAKQTGGFTEQSFEQCLSNQALLDNIRAVRQRASEKFGVNSTPTFFVNGKMMRGAVSMAELEKEMAPYLKAS